MLRTDHFLVFMDFVVISTIWFDQMDANVAFKSFNHVIAGS